MRNNNVAYFGGASPLESEPEMIEKCRRLQRVSELVRRSESGN